MATDLTVGTVLERAHTQRHRKRCPDCDGHLSIRGIGGEYTWECLECDALGFGYATRSAALEGAQAHNH